MAQLSALTAVVNVLKASRCDYSVIVQVAKSHGVVLRGNDFEFSDGDFTYSYRSDGPITEVRLSEIKNSGNFSELSIRNIVNPGTYVFTDQQATIYRRIICDKSSGCVIEYISNSHWKLVGDQLVRQKLLESPVNADDASVPGEVRAVFSRSVYCYAEDTRCLKHIKSVVPLIIALGLKYPELIVFAAQYGLL